MPKLPISKKVLVTVFLLAFAIRLLSLREPLTSALPSILFTLFSGFIIYLTGKRLKNRRIGLYSSIFFLFNPLVVLLSQQPGIHMIATFYMAILFYGFLVFKKTYARALTVCLFATMVIIESVSTRVPLLAKPTFSILWKNILQMTIGDARFDPSPLFYSVVIFWICYLLYVVFRKYNKQKIVWIFLAGLVLSTISPLIHVSYLVVLFSILLGNGAELRIQRVRIIVGYLFFTFISLVS